LALRARSGWAALADRLAAMRSGARAVRRVEAREPREPIRSHAFKDDPNFWLRSL
jgi:hypothetical protein